MNEAIRKGQYFFTDIRKEVVALYELDNEPLTDPRPRSPKEAYETAEEYFEDRFAAATEFLDLAQYALDKGSTKRPTFLLHQAWRMPTPACC
ncbi:MAG: hypothetical protein RLN99_00350 [Kiloniellaceae bacterium]